jgi:hypothetical protein
VGSSVPHERKGSGVNDDDGVGHVHEGKRYGLIDLGRGPECCFTHCADPQVLVEFRPEASPAGGQSEPK